MKGNSITSRREGHIPLKNGKHTDVICFESSMWFQTMRKLIRR